MFREEWGEVYTGQPVFLNTPLPTAMQTHVGQRTNLPCMYLFTFSHLLLPDGLEPLLVTSVQCLLAVSRPLYLTRCDYHLNRGKNIIVFQWSAS